MKLLNFDGFLNEVRGETFDKYIFSLFSKKFNHNKNNSNNSGYRISISGDSKKTEKIIRNTLKSAGLNNNMYSYDIYSPGTKSEFVKSGSYATIRITLLQNFRNFIKGEHINILDNLTSKGIITNKLLTPDTIGLSGSTYINSTLLINDTKTKLNKLTSKITPAYITFLNDLLDSVGMASDSLDITSLDKDIIKKIDFIESEEVEISSSDLAKIGKDFGEILNAIFCLNIFNTTKGAFFPDRSNEPLVDYYLDGYSFSAKSKQGAAPSISNIAAMVKKVNLSNIEDENERKVIDLIISLDDNPGVLSSLIISDTLNDENFILLNNMFDNKLSNYKNIKKKDLSQIFYDKCKEDPSKFYDNLSLFLNTLGRSFKEFSNWNETNILENIESLHNNNMAMGVFLSPLNYYIIDKLNNNDALIRSLSNLAKRFDIMQIYIDININKKEKSITFKIKKFKDSNFLFNTSTSVYNIDRNKVSFKMIK